MASSDHTRLAFVLHFHQPHGNLDKVFADATERCYRPTLELLRAHPHVKTGVHVSGPLLQWLEAHAPATLELLAELARRGQAEVLGGGLEEPMLAILPDRDAVGQLRAMADLCERLLGQRPKGMWLAERVWEPDLARVIALAGYEYTLLDDSHLFAAGVTGRPHGMYVTEKAGHTVGVLPIDRGLRVRIPFSDVPDVLAYLKTARGETLTYGDDVEKFGLWPTTEKRVWKDEWLEKFFRALAANAGWLDTILPREARKPHTQGLVYLPTISYFEMGAWTLPAGVQNQLADVTHELHGLESKALGKLEDAAAPFLRGGIWQGFLAKYPESLRIYRKMLRVSAMVEAAKRKGHPNAEAAERALYKGQCNCAYWHGLFGGLYLQHLRSALMSALLEAEALVSERHEASIAFVDHDGDLEDEILLEGPHANVYLSRTRGGSAFEVDLLGPRYHLTEVLGRRPEGYHRDVHRARVISDEELEKLGNVSAHDLVRAAEPDLEKKLVYDAYARGFFVDHLLAAGATIEALAGKTYAPLVDLPHAAYEFVAAERAGGGAQVELDVKKGGAALQKTIGLAGEAITCEWQLRSTEGQHEVVFATELAWSLLAPDAADGRSVTIGGAAAAPIDVVSAKDVDAVRIASTGLGVDVTVKAEPPCEVWQFPLETVSQSERGFERGYQGTVTVFAWRVTLGPVATTVRVTVSPTKG